MAQARAGVNSWPQTWSTPNWQGQTVVPTASGRVAPSGALSHHHGWETEGRCEICAEETVAHHLAGCTVRHKCPVAGVCSHGDFWELMEMPEIPKVIHSEGFQAARNSGDLLDKDENMHFGTRAFAYSDGSVK